MLCKGLQPTVEALLWTRLNLLRTFANNNPLQSTRKLELIRKRTGKYVRRLELSLGFIVQWLHWEHTGGEDSVEDITNRLLEALNSMIMIDSLRLQEMDDRSAPPEIASLINSLTFPELRRLYYTGTFKSELQGFLGRHPRTRTLFIEADVSSGAHELLATHKLERPPILLHSLTALETTVPILHALSPLLDPLTPLAHVTVSFGYHGSLSYLNSQIEHLVAQNAAFTNQVTGNLDGLVLPSVRILRLNKVASEVYPDALRCILPRFPNVTDIGNVVLSAPSSYHLIPALPATLKQVHLLYEGVMWKLEFDRVNARLKERCKDLTSVDLWAWNEAYHDFWVCRWGPEGQLDVRNEVWNAAPRARGVPLNPAILWL